MMEIRVGIKTAGELVLRKEGEFSVLENMLIGDGVHWERTIKALLRGEVEVIKPRKVENPRNTESLVFRVEGYCLQVCSKIMTFPLRDMDTAGKQKFLKQK